MAIEKYDELLSFDISGEFEIVRGTDDEGNPTFAVATGKTVKDDGEVNYTWQVNVISGDGQTNIEDGFCLKGDCSNLTKFIQISKNMFGIEIVITTWLMVLTKGEKPYILNAVCVGNEDRQSAWLEAINQVLGFVRLDGETCNFETLTLAHITDAAAGDLRYPVATPVSTQHSHLDFLERSRGALGMLGGLVQMNASGTEYSFQDLESHMFEDEETLEKILHKNTAFPLADTARKMGELFRVEEAAFQANEDREQEIEGGLVRRCKMYEAFRSFAWTLAAYCEKEGCTPEQVDVEILEEIAEFVTEERNYLNYKEGSFCSTLCAGDDIHNYYIPEGVPASVRQILIDSIEIAEDTPPENRVLSLEGLRKDLTFLYPAMVTVYDALAAERDFSEPLEGALPEVLYVWCSMTYAARNPIYTEDGPMTCWWDHPRQPATILPSQKPAAIREKKAPDSGYHFTYDKGVSYTCSQYTFGFPDSFRVEKNIDGRDFIAYLPNPDDPEDYNSSDFIIYAGQEQAGDTNEQMKLPAVYTAVYSAFTAAIPGSICWYYDRKELPGVIAASPDPDCVHANAIVAFDRTVKMLRFQIAVKSKKQGEACQELIRSMLDHFVAKKPVQMLTAPDAREFVEMTLTESQLKTWEELMEAYSSQLIFARNQHQENKVKTLQANNPGAAGVRKEVKEMLRYHVSHAENYLRQADAVYQLMRAKFPGNAGLKRLKKAMDEAFLALADQFVNIGEEKVQVTAPYLESYRSHEKLSPEKAIAQILAAHRDVLSGEVVAALEAVTGKAAPKAAPASKVEPKPAPKADPEAEKAARKQAEEADFDRRVAAMEAEKQSLQTAEKSLRDHLGETQRERMAAERAFDRDKAKIERMASNLNIYDYNIQSTVREIVTTADRAGKTLNAACMRLVDKLDTWCETYYVPGVDPKLMRSIAAEFNELTETSTVEIDFTGSFQGVSLGHMGDIDYQPTRESRQIAARWEKVAREAAGLDEKALLAKHGISSAQWQTHQQYRTAVADFEQADTPDKLQKVLKTLRALGAYRDAQTYVVQGEEKLPALEEAERRRKEAEEARRKREAEALLKFKADHDAWEKEKTEILKKREAWVTEELTAFREKLERAAAEWVENARAALKDEERKHSLRYQQLEEQLAHLGFFKFQDKKLCRQEMEKENYWFSTLGTQRSRIDREYQDKQDIVRRDVASREKSLKLEAEKKFPVPEEPKKPKF